MALSRRWLIILAPLVFLGTLLAVAWFQDPYFYLNSEALYRQAKEAESHGNIDLALALAQKSWRRNPDNSDCGTFLGWLYLKQNQPVPALEIFRQVWGRDAKATAALKGLAQGLNQTDKRPEALELLGNYLQAHPQDAEVLLFAAQLAGQREEDKPLALEYYRRHYQVQPTPEVRRTLVDMLTGFQRFKEAIPLQAQEAAQNPSRPEALHRLALLHYWSRDYDAATEVYQRLLEQAADNAAFRQEAAKTAEAAKNLDVAIKQYLWLFANSKGQKDYGLTLARLWSQKGNHAEAAAVLGSLMDKDLEADTIRWYGLELLLTGDLGQATKVYKKAWEKGDSHQETIVNLARLYASKKQFAKAAGMWDEAQRRQLIQGDLRWEAALTYSYAQQYPKAVSILAPMERDNPKYPRLLLFLGQMQFYQKNWGQAAHYFQRYLENNPDDLTARRLLAEALSFQPKAQEEALEAYKDLITRTNDVGTRLRRIALLLQSKHWEEARQELQDCPVPQEPGLIKEQARLLLWAGDLEGALNRYELFLKGQPQDREALLEKARVLIYLGRAPAAREILRRFPVPANGSQEAVPGDRAVMVALIQADLAQQDWQEASQWALRLYGSGFPQNPHPPRTWEEARTLTRKNRTDQLDIEERTWVARALCHVSTPEAYRLASDLAVANLHKNRHHHPSILILMYLLPRLSSYEDLEWMAYSIPGVKSDGQDYESFQSYFESQVGSQGGRLTYLLGLLKRYRRFRFPDSPGEMLALADLATELGERQEAEDYYRQAQQLWPENPRLAKLLLNSQMAQKDWGKALDTLNHKPITPENALEIARLYMMRGQYEGVKAAADKVPADYANYSQIQLLRVQASRLQKCYPEALNTLESLACLLPRDSYLMEKARILEAMGDRQALKVYAELIDSFPGTQQALVAEARRARAAGNLGGSYRAFVLALKSAPQDVELLNELEDIRQRQRPELASRAFAYSRGEDQAEENMRPWQFNRPDREIFGGLPNPAAIPVLQPETLWFQDSNRLYGWLLRATANFWVAKVVPMKVAVEYRGFHQIKPSQEQGPIGGGLGLDQVYGQQTTNRSRLRLADLVLGAGPVNLANRLKLSGELIFRRYWKRVDREIVQKGATWYPFPPPPHLIDEGRVIKGTQQDDQGRLLGKLQLDFPVGLKTDATLRFSRLDIFSLDPNLLPRLYQSVNNLGDVPLIILNQLDFNLNHQFSPALAWAGNISGALFSDENKRLTLYQGLTWQAIKEPRMQLSLTPHYYLTKYSLQKGSYFSPKDYNALGITLDFYRQIYRLPTIILQASVEGISQHGDWGPGFHGLFALEMEPVKNFYIHPHVFYFREWVDNYHILVLGMSLRYIF
uniref:Tetratricopeptide repeat protein n=1 Tax=Desulfobacca acetoxidans TaxID=60893 RepID=A0A7V6DNT1_9BACT